MRRSRRRILAPLAVVVLVACGCASLPDAGAPEPFDVSAPTSAPLDFAAPGPVKGSAPTALVSDFLRAEAAGATDDFATARLFLTEDASAQWKPESQVQVYSTDSSPTFSPDDSAEQSGMTAISVSAPAVATVDENGVLTRTESDSTISRQFNLVQVDGEWRIGGLEDGIILSESSFTASYQNVSLYFPSPASDSLVADPRWYPARRLATYLLMGLLAGPSTAISSAVVTAIPTGTTLPSQGIDVSSNVAHVVLTGTVPTDAATRRLVAWQVVSTLKQVQSVSSVELTVSGTSVDTTDLPGEPTYHMETAIGSGDSGLITVNGSTTQSLVAASRLGQTPSMPAMSPVGNSPLAWVWDNTVVADDQSSGQRAEATTDSPTWPSVDRYGWVWSASSTDDDTVVVLTPDGSTATVSTSADDHSRIVALRISPDGARVVIVRELADAQTVWVSPVERDGEGTPTGLGEAVKIAGLSDTAIDASWAGTSSLVVLRPGSSGSSTVVSTVPLGGFITSIPAPSKAVHITAGSSASSVYLMTSAGAIYSRSGSVWQPVTTGLSILDIEFPG